MSRYDKLLLKLLRGVSDANFAFDDLCFIVRHLGFDERVKGSHHIFTRAGIEEIINIQPRNDGKAKPYQVRQVRDIVLNHRLGGVGDES